MKTKRYQLPREFATKWVEALRSGKYKQGFNRYFDPKTDCFCSMGVAYNVNNIPLSMSGQSVDSEYQRVFKSNGGDNLLWWPLQELNDNSKLSFAEIADWIEQNVEFI